MCEQCANTVPASTGSRRRRLWDLPHQCHCPVVGVCLALHTLRSLVNKALGAKAMADDYEVHVGAVAECTQRNRLSELLHKELETRCARTIQAFKAAKTTQAVADLWAQAVLKGDVSGAFWAALTHPRCDEALQEAILREMHMLQHQAGAAVRIDAARFHDLIRENGVLARELGKAQERCTRLMAEKSADIEQLGARLIQQRAVVIQKDTRIACLSEDLENLKASLPEYENASRWQKKLEQLSARHAELEAQNAHLRQQLGQAQRSLSLREQEDAAKPASAQRPEPAQPSPAAFELQHRTVLCVGGRNGNVANYRNVIEKAGGRFAHHDGGLENNPGALDSSLAAADLVICQTGCISHNAYWRVKDFCKRTGKQCVFVESPSTSSLTRSLQQITGDGPAIEREDHQATP